MKRTANARWEGGLKDGRGLVSTGSGALDNTKYDFRMRFEEAPGTNPEELIAAAHAGCFSMAFSAELGNRGMTPERIETTCTVTLEMLPKGPTVTSSHLVTRARVPGGDAAKVREAAEGAKAGCPISRLLNTELKLDLTVDV
jgi:osmotically inducible protein OsmC